MRILQRTVRFMCCVQLKDRKISKDLMLGLDVSIGQLTMANSIHWYGCVLKREDGHVLERLYIFRLTVIGRKGGKHGHG